MVRRTRSRPEKVAGSVTAERAARLYRLLLFLGGGPKSRAALTRHVRLDVRGFYRDLKFLRKAGIAIRLEGSHYILESSLERALGSLPFPDPCLTLAEAQQLAKGRTRAHQKLKQQIRQILPQ
jgi:predicted DNA-binding transcriptional regulator YafY